MSEAGEEGRVDRLRDLATRVARRVGGVPAVQTLLAVLDAYDGAGGGLVAGGLAYAALFAVLPGLLLMLSLVGLVVDDPSIREQVVAAIARAVPPLEEVARQAFEQVSAGAVPTGVVAIVGLLWGSSRFYAALDFALSRVFRTARPRSGLERTVRGLLVSALIVATPIAALVAGSIASWLLDIAPGGSEIGGLARTAFQLASPLASFLLFVAGAGLVYRFVPATLVPARVLLPPALLAGLVLALIAQAFTFIAPRLVGVAALFGALVAVFAILAWLSISFNVLLLGASWTRVRLVAFRAARERTAPPEPSAG